MPLDRRLLIALGGFVLTTLGCSGQQSLRYPETKTVEHIDTYHGVEVPDPYRWLEQDVREVPEVAQWVEAENKVTFAYLESIPQRQAIQKRLTELWNFEKYASFRKTGGRYVFLKNDGLQNQYVLYVKDTLDAEPRVLIDPNTWSADGTIALDRAWFSEDGKYVVYSVAEAGSDWQTFRVMDVAGGKPLADEIKWAKFTEASWTKDGKGFYYGRFDEPKEGAAFQSLNLNQKIYYHRIGTPQAEDTLVYTRPDNPDWIYGTTVTDDGRYLVITIAKGTDDKYRIAYKDLTKPASKVVDLITNFDQDYTIVGNDGPRFFFRTDLGAPRKRLIAIDTRNPKPDAFQEIIPEAAETLTDISLINDMFVAQYLKDARSQVKIHALDGKLVREIELAGIATATGFEGQRSDKETFYTLTGFALPPTIYRLDMATGESTVLLQPKVKLDTSLYETKQVFYHSKDGTRIPMFITSRKGIALDGNNPTLLYGYGGFNISITPAFSSSFAGWMDLGGVLAIANLRGGGEYGEEWHQAGTRLRKQNVFDDFISAAEWLIENKYTRREKLAIHGRSNGGLLVGAVMTQRPDLFGACLPAVGVMDMLRFQNFTAGRFWTDDYGSSENPEEFKAIYAYSPYHNIKSGVKYPPTLVTTADTDDRVVPGHSFKFIAMLQAAQAGDAPVLARIETRAGHGAGKPTSKLIEETADQWAFLFKNLGMEMPKEQ